MRFLTVKQPYAWALFHGKPIENRTQVFGYRGRVGIHAGASWHEPGGEDPNVLAAIKECRPFGTQLVTGPTGTHVSAASTSLVRSAVLGVADLVDCHRAEPGCCDSPWAQYYDRATHLVFENPMLLTEPVYIRGELGLWRERCEADPSAPRHEHHVTCGLMEKVLGRLPLAA